MSMIQILLEVIHHYTSTCNNREKSCNAVESGRKTWIFSDDPRHLWKLSYQIGEHILPMISHIKTYDIYKIYRHDNLPFANINLELHFIGNWGRNLLKFEWFGRVSYRCRCLNRIADAATCRSFTIHMLIILIQNTIYTQYSWHFK